MKIAKKHNAEITAFTIKRNQSHDGREASVDLEIGVTKDQAASQFGEDFETLAFATMRVVEAAGDDEDEGGNAIAFLVDSIKPGRRVVFERHKIGLEEEFFEAQPEMLNIKPVDGEQRVIVKLRLPIDVGRTALITALASKVGQTVKVDFSPKQTSFGFEKSKGDSAEAEAH